jgi:nucleoside-diphosphate-sugar epimerase
MHVLIAGCGYLGKVAAAALLARGDRVTGIRRSKAAAAELSALGIEPLAVDLAAPGAAERIPADVDAILACQSARGDDAGAYREAYVDANRALLSAASARGVKAFVYTSSTGVFGQSDGGDVDEDSPPTPASASAAVLVEAERLVLEAAAAGVPARALRLSGLYGPGRSFAIDRVRSGALALGPGDELWMNFCHVEDAATFAVAALDRGQSGAIYHGTDSAPARRREVIAWIAQKLGLEPKHSSTAGALGPHRRVLGDRSRAVLGVTLRYPSFREGMAPLVASAR